MELKSAVAGLAALAQEHRLAAFRLLVGAGPAGMPAGLIAGRLAMPPSTLSHHLAQLERAGLVRSRRVDRRIFYALDVEGTRRLLTFLTEDCCQGHPELCGYPPGASAGCGPPGATAAGAAHPIEPSSSTPWEKGHVSP
jgi:DNA-binding transcriptional ArsR family regulator